MLPENILFSQDPAKDLIAFLTTKNYSKIALIGDENTLQNCYPKLHKLPAHVVIEVKSGEQNKNLSTCEHIWRNLTAHAFDRHSVLVVLGGGVLGDMGGFCAATYKRGIDFILIPTTLLAQVDASIGGKLGIDFDNLKNHIGVFQQPTLTLLYSGFLDSLPSNELRSGYAEVVKHCLISDKNMWDVISEKNLAEQDWKTLLKHSVHFKARITTEDPKEKGLRKILNAGHTIGHAVETFSMTSNVPLLHGDAIAIGLVAEGFIAKEKGLLTTNELESICRHVRGVFGKYNFDNDDIDKAAQLTIQDKKNKDSKILCVLLKGIGNAVWDIEITTDDIKRSLSFYQAL